jgi:uncharacterized damage-inducible protein DinB
MVLSMVMGMTNAAQADEAPFPSSGFRAELLHDLDWVSGKIVRLAEAIPPEKLGWRAAPEVKSLGELFLHLAGSTYYITQALGLKAPGGRDPKTCEKATADKGQILEELRGAAEHARKAVLGTPEVELDRIVQRWGKSWSHRAILLILLRHTHEHFGQATAFARVAGVEPPWISEQRAKEKAARDSGQ